MTIKYLKKAIKNPSTDDTKTRETVQNILNDIEKRREDAIKEITRTKDCQEGIRAFLEKREPNFKGPYYENSPFSDNYKK